MAAFSRRVADAVTQPLLVWRGRTFAPSIMLDMLVPMPDGAMTIVIEVDAGDGRLDAATLTTGRAWCADMRAVHRVVEAASLKTPHLGNARLLAPDRGHWPSEAVINALWDHLAAADGRSTVGTAVEVVQAMRQGIDAAAAEMAVRRAVANSFVECDLSVPYGHDLPLAPHDPTSQADVARDPFISRFL